MATTYELIASQTLASAAASIDFTSIPGTFDDLLLVCSLRGSRTDITFDQQRIRLNGDTGSNYSTRFLYGNGSTAVSSADASNSAGLYVGYHPSSTATANTFGNSEVYIPNYAGSTNKTANITAIHETNASTAYAWVSADIWASASAITSMSIYTGSGNLVAGSSAYLYGITRA